MADLIEIFRSSSACWIVIDGVALPAAAVDDASVDVDPTTVPTVTITLRAARIKVDNCIYVAEHDRDEDHHGKAEG